MSPIGRREPRFGGSFVPFFVRICNVFAREVFRGVLCRNYGRKKINHPRRTTSAIKRFLYQSRPRVFYIVVIVTRMNGAIDMLSRPTLRHIHFGVT